MKPIDFWYSIGSTYSYLTVMRLPEYAAQQGVVFNWRPFDVRAIMTEQNNIPFAHKPAKSSHMWRDIERRAGKYGLPIKVPVPYPLEELVFANQVALLGMREGWGQDYTVEAYRMWFTEGKKAGTEANVSECLKRIGQDPVRVIKLAHSPEIASALVDETTHCRELGIFGAPSFVVDGEVFWGNDRLEDAVSWRKNGCVR